MAQEKQDIVWLLSDESFQRWITGKASEAEIGQWQEWLNAVPHHRELHAQALRLWSRSRFQPAALPDVDAEWQKLQRRMEWPSAKTASILKLSPKRFLLNHGHASRFAWRRFGVAAAAAVVLIALLWRVFPIRKQPEIPKMQVVSTDYGQRVRITLPEGTTIILNAQSTLRYPAHWTAMTPRRFELQGEAYFDVSASPEGRSEHHFVVHTDDGAVQVVGTRFVVYERNGGTRVVVEEGGVEVIVADTTAMSQLPAAKVLLKPGDLLRFRMGSRDLNPQVVNIGVYTTWWRDHLTLEDTPFEEIISRLEETYGIEVKVEDKRLLKRTLSGSIENRSLNLITEALAKALRVSVHREGQLVVFGHSPKRK